MEAKTQYMVVRMKAIEQELEDMRKLLEQPISKKIIKIEGLWKGIDITEEDIAQAKRSLFKEAYGI